MPTGQRTPTHDLRPLCSPFQLPLMPAREYVEAEFLGRYLWNYYGAILSVDERTAIFAALMAVDKSVPWGAFDPPPAPPIPEHVIEGLATAFRRAGDRVLEEYGGDSTFINRCPRCGRIVVTPLARQCMWCHHDWHGPSGGAHSAD